MTVKPSHEKIAEATLRNISIAKPQKSIDAEASANSDLSSISNPEDTAHVSGEASQEPLDAKGVKAGKKLDYYFNSPELSVGKSNYDESSFKTLQGAVSKLQQNNASNISSEDLDKLNRNISSLMEAEDPYNQTSDSDSRKSAYHQNISEIMNKYNISATDILQQANTKQVQQPLANNTSSTDNLFPFSDETNSTGNINVEAKNADHDSTEIYTDQFGKTHEKRTMYSKDGDLEYTSKKNYNDDISTDTHIENAQTAMVDGSKNEKREEAVASPGEKLKVEADINKEDENKIHIEGKAHKFESQEMSNDKGDFSQQVRLQSEGTQDQTVISTSIDNEEGKTKTDIQDIDANKNMKSVVTKNGDSVTITSSNGEVQSSVTIPEDDGFFERTGKGFSNLLFGEEESSYNANGNVQVFSENGNTDVVTQNAVIHAGDEDDSYSEQLGRGADYVKDSAWSGIKSAWGWTKSWFADPSSK